MMTSKPSKENLLEAIDPRFRNVFNKKGGIAVRNNGRKRTFSETPRERSSYETEHGSSSRNGVCEFISRKLDAIIDRNIKEVDHTDESQKLSNPVEGGIQLFSDSEVFLMESTFNCTMQDDERINIGPCKKRKKKKKSERCEEEEIQRFQEVAVSAEWVLRQSAIYNS